MGRLSKHQFLVLVVLLRQPMHPYAVRQEVINLTGHHEWPSQSTIRGVLDKLLAVKYIEECRRDNPHHWLRARRGAPYELTEAGYWIARRELSMYHEVIIKSRAWLEKFDN